MLPHLPKLWLWAPLTVELVLAADDDTPAVIASITEVALSIHTLDGDRIPLDDPMLIYKTSTVLTNTDKSKGPHASITLSQGDIMNITEAGDYWIAVHVTAGGERYVRAAGYITLVDDGFPVAPGEPTAPGNPYLTEGAANGLYLTLDQTPEQTGLTGHKAEICAALGAAQLSGAAFTGAVSVGGKTVATTDNTNGLPSNMALYGKWDQTGAVTKGTPCYIYGANGSNKLLRKADAATEGTSSKTIGLLLQDIADTGAKFGYVITEGDLLGITVPSGATVIAEGASVWLGAGGGFAFASPPAKPNHSVFLGVVTRFNGSTFDMYVKVQNGYELDELHNVIITSPDLQHSLFYNGSNWVNRKVEAADLGSTIGGVTAKFLRGDMSWQTVTTSLDLNGLTDVEITGATLANKQSLFYDGSGWVNRAITVTDISATGTPSNTTYLRGDGQWVTVTSGSGATSLDGLSDVVIGVTGSTGEAIGKSQLLAYNGSEWVNTKSIGVLDDVMLDAVGTLALSAVSADTVSIINSGEIKTDTLVVDGATTSAPAATFAGNQTSVYLSLGKETGTANPVLAILGGYGGSAAGTIYFGQNSYWTGSAWARKNGGVNACCTFWMQNGRFYWSGRDTSGSAHPSDNLNMHLTPAGDLYVKGNMYVGSTFSPSITGTAVGTVTGISVAPADGITGEVTGTGALTITLNLGNITPEKVNNVTITTPGSGTHELTVSGTAYISGSNTGDKSLADLTGAITVAAHALLAGPTSGGVASPSFRTLVAEDLGTGTATSGKVLSSAGTGAFPAWIDAPTGSGATPAGSDGYIQYKDGSGFGANSGLICSTTTGAITQTQASLAATTVAGLTLTNATAATSSVQQVSPSILWNGQGWSTSGPATMGVPFRAFVDPASGAPATGTWRLQSGIGGTYTDRLTVASGGAVTAASFVSGSTTMSSSGYAVGNSNLTNTGLTLGLTAATLYIANRVYLRYTSENSNTAYGWLTQGAVDSGAAVVQRFYVQNSTGSNQAGATRYIGGSRGTGSSAGGDIVFETSAPGSSGATQNALATSFTIKGDAAKSSSFVGPVGFPSYAVASLPAAASYAYHRAFATDANSTTFGSTVAGGGSNKVPVYSDGTNWIIG